MSPSTNCESECLPWCPCHSGFNESALPLEDGQNTVTAPNLIFKVVS